MGQTLQNQAQQKEMLIKRKREYFLNLFQKALLNTDVAYVTWWKDVYNEASLPWDKYTIRYLPKETELTLERAIITKKEGEKPVMVELLLPEKEKRYITKEWLSEVQKELGITIMLGWCKETMSQKRKVKFFLFYFYERARIAFRANSSQRLLNSLSLCPFTLWNVIV